MSLPFFTGASSEFSRDGVYRYTLERSWRGMFDAGTPARVCLFVMLNPSTADASREDPTVRRCVTYAQAWGCDTLLVGNLFAFRSTDPKVLPHQTDPIGPDNDHHLARLAGRADVIIAAWGIHGALHGRAERVLEILSFCRPVQALHVTADGFPGHPLYLPKAAAPLLYRAQR